MFKKLIKLQKILKNPFFRRSFFGSGVAASVEHIPLFDLLSHNDYSTIIDIGANRGQFALIARYYFPNAIIHSFEPLKEAAESFRILFKKDPNIFLHEYALGAVGGKMEIHVSKRDDSSSLLPISNLQSSTFPGTDEKEIRHIEVKPLEEVIQKTEVVPPVLVKIDVQGAELEVLKGCETMLPCFDYLYIECSFMELYVGQSLAHEVISFLDKRGFILSGIYNLEMTRRGVPIQGDFLFARNK